MRRWQGATTLPIDQLILTLAQDLFTSAVDLALAHKLALVLHRAAEQHPNWRLPELTRELAVVAKNERKFLGLFGGGQRLRSRRASGRSGGRDDAQGQGLGVG